MTVRVVAALVIAVLFAILAAHPLLLILVGFPTWLIVASVMVSRWARSRRFHPSPTPLFLDELERSYVRR